MAAQRHSLILTLALALALLGGGCLGCAAPRREAVSRHTKEIYTNRYDGLVSREVWEDTEGGGGWFLGTDPNVASMFAGHTNQTALGGGSVFIAGPASISMDTNLAPVISATGTAVGNVVGAAVKTAVK